MAKVKNKTAALRRLAKEYGVEKNELFRTTLERYAELVRIADALQEDIQANGVMTTKTNVKGFENTAVNPSVTEYNKISVTANGTVVTLINIIKKFENTGKSTDDLDAFLNA